MTRYQPLVIVLIVALALASAAGCDGDEETSETEEPPPTRQEFIAQANAICRSAGQEINAQAREVEFYVPDGLDEEEAEFVEEVVIPFYQGQVDEIRALTPPPGDEEEIEAALSAAERGLAADLLEDPDRVPKGWLAFVRWFQRYGGNPVAAAERRGPCVD